MSTQQDKPYKYGVTAYNQGFYKFGPMEQCATGEWVKWKDVEPFLRDELSIKVAYQTHRAENWKKTYYAEKGRNEKLQASLDTWRALCIGMAVAFLVVVYYFVRIGA